MCGKVGNKKPQSLPTMYSLKAKKNNVERNILLKPKIIKEIINTCIHMARKENQCKR